VRSAMANAMAELAGTIGTSAIASTNRRVTLSKRPTRKDEKWQFIITGFVSSPLFGSRQNANSAHVSTLRSSPPLPAEQVGHLLFTGNEIPPAPIFDFRRKCARL